MVRRGACSRRLCLGEGFCAGESAFEALVERRSGVPVVRLSGEVDLETIPRVEEAFSEAAALRDGISGLVLDLGDVTFMDSTGISALVGQRAGLGEGDLWLVLGGGGAGRTLELAGISSAFRVSPDLETAVREAREAAGS